MQNTQNKKSSPPPVGIIVSVVVFIVVLILLSIRIVQPGYVGVVVRLGKALPKALDEGIHCVVPLLSSVKPMDARIQKAEHKIAAASKDLQLVDAEVSLNYHIDRFKATDLYRDVGLNYESIIIQPKVEESLKASFTQYAAEALLSERMLISSEIQASLTKQLQDYGVEIDAVNITDLKFSPEFNRMIEEKMVAEQRAMQAKQIVESARAAAEAMIEKARGETEAMKLKKEIATPDLLFLAAIEKWDGKLPTHLFVMTPTSLSSPAPTEESPDCIIIADGLLIEKLCEK